jgi:hypothetical protein
VNRGRSQIGTDPAFRTALAAGSVAKSNHCSSSTWDCEFTLDRRSDPQIPGSGRL